MSLYNKRSINITNFNKYLLNLKYQFYGFATINR